MIKLIDWTVAYPDGTKALDRLSLSAGRGERTALIGGNGAGKSSLIRSLVGILPGQGTAEIAGLEVRKENLQEIRRRTGVVFQNPDD